MHPAKRQASFRRDTSAAHEKGPWLRANPPQEECSKVLQEEASKWCPHDVSHLRRKVNLGSRFFGFRTRNKITDEEAQCLRDITKRSHL